MKSKSPARSAAARPMSAAVTKSAPVRKPRTRKAASVDVAGAVANDAPANAVTLSPEMIADRAYALYIEQGGENGRDLEHWLAAERELMSRA